jgi:hypothetical protein
MAAESELQEYVASAASAVAEKGYLGGELKAAMLQGFNELGAALKAFPDSIQIDEPGTAFNPLYRDRDGDTPAPSQAGGQEPAALPSPSEIAAAGQAQGSVYGEAQQASAQSLPSPSEIASNPAPYLPPEDQGNVHGQEMGRSM